MKNITTVIITILTALTAAGVAFAQKLTVESMTMETMDLSAARYSRSDRNGETCALVKVQIPLEGMVFEGNVLGDVENKAGEYWVYLCPGTKFFEVKHRSVTPLFVTFADYGLEPLAAKTTYVLKLSAPTSVAPVEEVTFKVSPANAVLFVDGVEQLLSNGMAILKLPCGEHNYSVIAQGYVGQTDDFRVRQGVTNKKVIELDPKAGIPTAIAATPTPAPAPASPTVDFAAIKAEADKAYDDGYYNRALELYMKIADNRGIQNRVGWMYERGQGVSQDLAEAARWYRKSAEQGNSLGQNNLGRMYQYGKGVSQDYVEAVRWYRKAAEQGDADAQSNLGTMYRDGLGVNQDYAEAVRWYRKVAEQGNTHGQTNLGYMYEHGFGVSQDYAEAARWYRKAAEQGNANAQNNLGNMYANGLGLSKDYNESAKWFEKSAKQGNMFGCSNWGWSLYYGHGVTQDRQEAYRWLKKAADAGSDYAKKFLAEHTF